MFVLVSTPRTRRLPDPSHPRLQLTNFPQDVNMVENRLYLKKKKGRASQCLPAEPHTHAEPALIVSLLCATFPNHRAFERAAVWKAHSTPPGNSFPSLSSQFRILSELRVQGHPSTTSFSLVSLRHSTPPGVCTGSQQNLSVTVHRVFSIQPAAVG